MDSNPLNCICILHVAIETSRESNNPGLVLECEKKVVASQTMCEAARMHSWQAGQEEQRLRVCETETAHE